MNVLILRFSAMGDVAMTVPVIDSLARQHPKVNFVVASQHFFSPLFEYMPENVHFFPVFLKKEHKGIAGMYRLFRQLKKLNITHVADIHDVLRTKTVRNLFRLTGVKSAFIDKGRKEKKALTRKKNKDLHPLKSSFTRYQEVFLSLKLDVNLNFSSVFGDNKKGELDKITYFTGDKKEKWVGIAPFAKHTGKIYPLNKTEEIIKTLSEKYPVKIFLFGGGNEEGCILSSWEEKYNDTFSVYNKIKGLKEELILMSHLEVMYSMDSANMHLASLTHTPVVSVWGATHPYAGFLGWNQSLDDAIGTDIYCRPCSVYGNKPCYRKDYACLEEISPQQVVVAIEKYLL